MKHLISCFLILWGTLFAEASYTSVQDESHLAIKNPTLGERQQAKIRLPNGLEAYLISDPGIEQSSAALAVETGSWHDPAEYPGMAHFLEHMLFMGTKAYPTEEDYWNFISDRGGKVNAYTACDRTVYMFSINNEGFEGALDRFSHFFIDPLFLPSCIDRELHAVDQEHAKNIENDGWRQYMIFKETGNQSHPNAKFSTGNAQTLGGIPQKAMKTWYKENYSANKMHLVVLSALPLDQLIQLTVQDFTEVPTTEKRVEEKFPANMTTEAQKGHFIYIKPVKDLKILSMTWELTPTLAQNNDAHVQKLLAYVLQSGSKNSLLGLLKRDHLATALQVGEESLSKTNKLFTIDVELTEKGLQELDQVINCCFEALARLKKTGIPEYVFDEVKNISEIQYAYQSRKDAFEFVMETAHKLVDEELETFPQKTLVPTQYDPTLNALYIDHLTPENCIFFVVADPEKVGLQTTKKEKWMDAAYTIQEVDQKELLAWSRAGVNPQIGLPPPNPFIPKNMEIVSESSSSDSPEPLLLQNSDQGKIYFATDHKYHTPEVSYLFRIKSPHLDGSAKSKALADLYIKSVSDQLFPITSAAETAGAKVAIEQDHFALAVAINGYSDGSSRLAEDIFKGMKKNRPSQEQFALYKESLCASYENAQKELPFLQSMVTLTNILVNDAPTYGEKLAALKEISYEDFLEFSNSLFKKTYVEGLLYGNLTQDSAEKLWSQLKGKFKATGYPLKDQHKREILTLTKDQGPYMVMQPTPMQGNAAILLIEQGPYTFKQRAAQQVLGTVLKYTFFDTLRTKQQVAYIAKAWEKEEEKQLLQLFGVQSSSHKPSELISRFELFLEDFVKQFTTKFPEERFDNIRNMAITTLEMPPENLFGMGTRLFILGFDQEGDFALVEKRVAALKELTYRDVRNFANETLSRQNLRRIAILVEGIQTKENSFSYELISKDELRGQGIYVAWK